MMRVCFFSRLVTLHAKGGMQYDLDIRARWLLDRGHEVVVLTTRHPSLPSFHCEAGVQYHFLNKTRSTRQDPAWRKESAAAFLELQQTQPFDLIVAMGGSGWRYAQLLARHPELPPAVLMVQMPTAQLLSYLLRKPTPTNLAKALRLAYYWMAWTKPYGRYFQAIVVLSEWTRTYALAEDSYVPERVHVISNGIDIKEFSPGAAPAALQRKLQINPDDKVALWVGRFMRYKGWMDVLEASVEVAARVPNYRLVMLAGGMGNQRSQFWQAVARLGLGDQVRLVEDVDRQDLPDHYRLGHCLVAPFHGPEAQPWVLLESMACGVPVVTSDIPELSEFAGDETGTLVVPVQRRSELAQSIEKLLASGEAERQTRALRARQVVVDRFDAQHASHTTVQLLESVARRATIIAE